MILPYKVATLLYCFNERDEILLLERAKQPNLGFWSPCGGKLKTDIGESPYVCAAREAHEELRAWNFSPRDFHLAGLVSEHGFPGPEPLAHVFVRAETPSWKSLPPPMSEGRFQFYPRARRWPRQNIPQTDREQIWPWFWQYRGGFFAAHCHCHPDGRNEWKLEEAIPCKVGPSSIPSCRASTARRSFLSRRDNWNS